MKKLKIEESKIESLKQTIHYFNILEFSTKKEKARITLKKPNLAIIKKVYSGY